MKLRITRNITRGRLELEMIAEGDLDKQIIEQIGTLENIRVEHLTVQRHNNIDGFRPQRIPGLVFSCPLPEYQPPDDITSHLE